MFAMVARVFPVAILPLVIGLLFVTNFAHDLWLTGWDNLHTEFNFWFNIKRSIFAVWQEYQGLGLIGGMGHASDLPRQLALLFLSWFLPDNWLRQFYFFISLLAGSLGMYFLLDRIVLKGAQDSVREIASTLGGLFYILNLATLQTFYIPFEPFITHFASLPWLFLTALLYFKEQSTKNALVFFLVSFLSVPQGYVPTVFIVYFLSLGLVLLFLSLQKKGFYPSLKILIFTLVVNAFWLLPFTWFVFTNLGVPIEAKMNQMSSEENFLRNKNFGNFFDVVLLKGFWFETNDLNSKGAYSFLIEPWRIHFENHLILGIALILFSLVLAGIYFGLKTKNFYSLPFFALFLLAFTLLANDTPPFSWIDSIFYRSPLFAQIFRFPFTKFSILASFSFSIFFSFAFVWWFTLLGKMTHGKLAQGVVFCLFSFTLLLVFLPSFQGNLFYRNLKFVIPREYTNIFQFFQKQPKDGRIANFPQHTFWGWHFYKWGYRGSGFLWYDIEQPILDRAFDVWSAEDENYYWEMSYAIYSNNLKLFENVLEKYQVQWLLIDESVINPSSSKSTYLDELYAMLLQSDKVQKAEEFGFLKVYRVNLDVPVKDFVFVLDNPAVVEPSYKWGNYDEGFGGVGGGEGYISSTDYSLPARNTTHSVAGGPTTAYYPFRSLFTGKNQEDIEFEVEDKDDHFVFKSGGDEGRGYLEVPRNWRDDLVWVNPENLGEKLDFDPEVYFDGKNVLVKIPKVGGLFSVRIDGASLGVEQKSIYLPNLPHRLGYLITVEGQNIKGRPFLFWLENLNSRKSDIETYLPENFHNSVFIQPPMEEDGLGYTLHFDNVSPGSQKSVNVLGEVEVNPIPYKFLTGLVIRSGGSGGGEGDEGGREVLVLSQSFNKGWVALTWDGLLPKLAGEHVLVNNWANGWVLSEGVGPPSPEGFGEARGVEGVRIIFWPQILEYVGFLFGLGFLILVWRRKI